MEGARLEFQTGGDLMLPVNDGATDVGIGPAIEGKLILGSRSPVHFLAGLQSH